MKYGSLAEFIHTKKAEIGRDIRNTLVDMAYCLYHHHHHLIFIIIIIKIKE